MSLATPRLVVLDTNVRLDLFVFAAPRAARLGAALDCGQLRAVCNPECRAEWEAVLAYPKLRLDHAQQAAARSAHDRLVHLAAGPRRRPVDAALLPRCRDPDDQKFVQLAYDCSAAALLTRDLELLRLARRLASGFGIAVLQPQDFAQLFTG
jgi:putative PIN family toxin of toxin-antitoxin system